MIINKKILPSIKKYQDVNKNEVEFIPQIAVEKENRGIRKNLTTLNTEREDIK